MKCMSCGTENADNANFCKGCGAKLGVNAQANAQAQDQPSAQQQQTQGQPSAQSYSQQNAQQSYQQQNAQQNYQQQNQQQNSQQYAQPQYVATSAFKPKSDNIDNSQYTASAFGSGWADISNSKEWFVRSLLLGLCSLVPILRWVVSGFANRWGRELCLGINRRLPKSIFEEHTFLTGFKIWVCEVAYAAIFVAAFFILMLVPVLGPIVFVLAIAAFSLISPLLDFQIALSGKISAGFTGIGRSFKLIAKAPIKTLASTLGPSFLVSAVVTFIVSVIFCALLLAFSGSMLADAVSYSMTYSSSSNYALQSGANSIINSFFALGGLSIFLMIVAWFVYVVGDALSTVWVARSLGHLVSREATEWLRVPGFVDLSNTDLPPNSIPAPFTPFQNR